MYVLVENEGNCEISSITLKCEKTKILLSEWIIFSHQQRDFMEMSFCFIQFVESYLHNEFD